MSKDKDKKAARKQRSNYIKGNIQQVLSGLLGRYFADQEKMGLYIQTDERKQHTKHPDSKASEMKVKQSFSDKQNLKQFITTKSALQDMLNGVLQPKPKVQ